MTLVPLRTPQKWDFFPSLQRNTACVDMDLPAALLRLLSDSSEPLRAQMTPAQCPQLCFLLALNAPLIGSGWRRMSRWSLRSFWWVSVPKGNLIKQISSWKAFILYSETLVVEMVDILYTHHNFFLLSSLSRSLSPSRTPLHTHTFYGAWWKNISDFFWKLPTNDYIWHDLRTSPRFPSKV